MLLISVFITWFVIGSGRRIIRPYVHFFLYCFWEWELQSLRKLVRMSVWESSMGKLPWVLLYVKDSGNTEECLMVHYINATMCYVL
jgi:hypothetical protein